MDLDQEIREEEKFYRRLPTKIAKRLDKLGQNRSDASRKWQSTSDSLSADTAEVVTAADFYQNALIDEKGYWNLIAVISYNALFKLRIFLFFSIILNILFGILLIFLR